MATPGTPVVFEIIPHLRFVVWEATVRGAVSTARVPPSPRSFTFVPLDGVNVQRPRAGDVVRAGGIALALACR
jgi:hypothetical protein